MGNEHWMGTVAGRGAPNCVAPSFPRGSPMSPSPLLSFKWELRVLAGSTGALFAGVMGFEWLQALGHNKGVWPNSKGGAVA